MNEPKWKQNKHFKIIFWEFFIAQEIGVLIAQFFIAQEIGVLIIYVLLMEICVIEKCQKSETINIISVFKKTLWKRQTG